MRIHPVERGAVPLPDRVQDPRVGAPVGAGRGGDAPHDAVGHLDEGRARRWLSGCMARTTSDGGRRSPVICTLHRQDWHNARHAGRPIRSPRAADGGDVARRRRAARALHPGRVVRAARPAPAAGDRHDHRRGAGGRPRGAPTGHRRRAVADGDRERRARRVPGHAVDRDRGDGRGDRRARPLRRLGGRRRARQRSRRQPRRRRRAPSPRSTTTADRVLRVVAARRRRRRPRRAHRDVAAAGPAPRPRPPRSRRAPARRRRCRRSATACGRAACARSSANGVLGDPTGASAAEGAALLRTLVDDLAAAVVEWLAPAGAAR